MSAFSDRLRATSLSLCKQYGEAVELKKVTPGEYDPITGETSSTEQVIKTFASQTSKMNESFSLDGTNTNLSGFDTEDYIIPWPGEVIDTTWMFNDANITHVNSTSANGDVIIYTISVGSK